MEKDCILGQGAPSLAKDRLMDHSDAFQMWVCEHCGLQAILEKKDGESSTKMCNLCISRDVNLVKLPYATKLLSQELAGMNVMARILTKPYQS